MLARLRPGATWLDEPSPELRARLRRADLVWPVALPTGERLLLHVELQTRLLPECLSVKAGVTAELPHRLGTSIRAPVRTTPANGQVARSRSGRS